MIKIAPLDKNYISAFKRLFTDYYTELDCGEDVEHLLNEYVLPDFEAGLIKVGLALDGKDAVGFIIYQIDDIDNEWNYKEGWGDIREIFVKPASRRKGFARALIESAEVHLKISGAQKAYCLPLGSAIPLFTACGYKSTANYDEEFDCFIFEKTF